MKYDALREKALANFELLLNYWKIDYKKITDKEYDILATWRSDTNFGSCRFNIEKGRGADFAGSYLSKEDFSRLGIGFDKEDFTGFSEKGQSKIGFDVIGFCQRIYNCNTYALAAQLLNSDFIRLSNNPELIIPTQDASERRKKEQEEKSKKLKTYAKDLWESCKYHNLKDTPGELYLRNRNILIPEKTIRYHPGIIYGPTKKKYPALIFKVQKEPDGELIAVHRVYLSQDGKKANVDNPKMALASIKSGGIWFGNKSSILYIAEGPENALSLRSLGAEFVVSTIFGTNFHNIYVPIYVTKIILVPDIDRSGMEAHYRALENYKKLDITIQEILIPKVILPNGKLADVNNALEA